MLAAQLSRLGGGLSRQQIVSSESGDKFKMKNLNIDFKKIYFVTPDTSIPSDVPCSVPVSESVCTTSADEHFPSGQHLPPLH